MSAVLTQTTIRATPILFSGPMVRAILGGRKTQTRRVIKTEEGEDFCGLNGYDNAVFTADNIHYREVRNRYGSEGDWLRVKESFYAYGQYRYTGRKTETGKPEVEFVDLTIQSGFSYQYAADTSLPKPASRYEVGWHKRPSIFMPLRASRVTLEIIAVRVERLQDIGGNDAREEGVCDPADTTPRSGLYRIGQFREGWDRLNAARGFGWDVNPFVWVISFKRV